LFKGWGLAVSKDGPGVDSHELEREEEEGGKRVGGWVGGGWVDKARHYDVHVRLGRCMRYAAA
jgi:hypothetical protein